MQHSEKRIITKTFRGTISNVLITCQAGDTKQQSSSLALKVLISLKAGLIILKLGPEANKLNRKYSTLVQ